MATNTITYNFNTEDDLGFYILNAVCHDWIHDFNNYARMGKLLNYILQLVNPKVETGKQDYSLPEEDRSAISDELTTIGSSLEEAERTEAGIIQNEDKMEVEEMDQGSPETVFASPAAATASVSDTPNELDISESSNILDEGAVTIDNTPSSEPTQQELILAQDDEYLEKSVSTGAVAAHAFGPHSNIVNSGIKAFNTIKTKLSGPGVMTRGNLRKINILQKLQDFVDESKLLVISKLRSGRIIRKGGRKQRGGSSGINVITVGDISDAIFDVIDEINSEINLSINDKNNLKNIFELMNQVFVNFNIPGISQLEKFNSSLINDVLYMFISNGCKTINIKQEAILYLQYLIPASRTVTQVQQPVARGVPRFSFTPKLNSYNNINTGKVIEPSSPRGVTEMYGGGPFSKKIYDANRSSWGALDGRIEIVNGSDLGNIYKGLVNISTVTDVNQLSAPYTTFITGIEPLIKLIVGPQMYNATTKQINNLIALASSSGRTTDKYKQQLVDTINAFIFDKIINVYNNVKKNSESVLEELEGSEGRLSGSAQTAVQKISRLLAKKVLELTGYPVSIPRKGDSLTDLQAQIGIISEITQNDKGYTSADDKLLAHFTNTYTGQPNFMQGESANSYLVGLLQSCNKAKGPQCRTINNAIPMGNVKKNIVNSVICPTSSVCDGMGAFGSCVKPGTKAEYYNMDFIVSGPRDSGNFYQGKTTLKPNNVAVNINYGFSFNDLHVYNFLDINIDTQPIILQANYTFKGVINRIIEIWKLVTRATTINDLWETLEGTEYFLSILKLGSQKAVGDIFQEINSTLANGGYATPTNISSKLTFGLMGDRPSGVRVIKLLKDFDSGINPKACGGYIGGDASTLIYVSTNTSKQPNTVKGGPVRVTDALKKQNRGSTFLDPTRKGGKKTHKLNKHLNRLTKKRNIKNNKKTRKLNRKINRK